MKNLLALALFLVLAPLANALAGQQDFTLVNKTEIDIHSVYVCPHGSEDWQEDVMGKDILEKGGAVDIKFERDAKAKSWDLKVVDRSGKGYVWQNINLLEVSKVTIQYKDGNATATYE